MKKFRVIKTGIFLKPSDKDRPNGAPARPQQQAPIGSIIQLSPTSAALKMWLRCGQIENVSDDVEVTFAP